MPLCSAITTSSVALCQSGWFLFIAPEIVFQSPKQPSPSSSRCSTTRCNKLVAFLISYILNTEAICWKWVSLLELFLCSLKIFLTVCIILLLFQQQQQQRQRQDQCPIDARISMLYERQAAFHFLLKRNPGRKWWRSVSNQASPLGIALSWLYWQTKSYTARPSFMSRAQRIY